jgi:hypothetical protein
MRGNVAAIIASEAASPPVRGPCDLIHHGESADDVIEAQDRHLKEMTAKSDTAHEQAAKEMKGRWKNPIKGMGWYKKAKSDFARLPED